ncbi:MAG: hypothetical protein K2J20_04825 [Bacilli bacterium]|nr:hypothetical protein [Bacilli bacterium]
MELEEILEKIEEWEIDARQLTTSTMRTLMQQLITAGESVIINLKILTDAYNKNEESYNICIRSLQEALNAKDINAYCSLFGADFEQVRKETEKEFKREDRELRNSKEVQELSESMKSKSLDEIMEDFDGLIKKADNMNRLVKQNMIEGIQQQIGAYSAMFCMDKLLLTECISFIKGAFNYHDYGQWEKIKRKGVDMLKDAILGFNKLFQWTALIADIVNLLDKEAVKGEFFEATESNIAKIEGQINALTFVKLFMDILIQHYQEDTYNLQK